MRWKPWLSLLAITVAGCGTPGAPANDAENAGLEAAALARGLVRSADNAPLTGLYARGADRVCIVERGGGARIGVISGVGSNVGCAAAGIAERTGGGMSIVLGAGRDCTFRARFDGDRITFPARLPEGCARFCNGRASLSALGVSRLSDSESEASALRDSGGQLVCAD